MREIRFRLIKDGVIVGYETHAIDPSIGAGICVYHKSVNETKLKHGYPITGGDKWFIFHDKKDQYIGIKDKNEKEVCERDLVLLRGLRGGFYNNEDKVIKMDDIRDVLNLFQDGYDSNGFEVTGNIYEDENL